MSSGPDGMPSPDANGGAPQETVQLVEIELRHIPQVCQVINEGFRTKRCCFVFPVPESESEMRRRYSGYPASKLALGAVAVQENTNKIIGYVQMAVKGHPVFPLNIHTCRAGEMYIEQIAVSADARGMGVGTKLLDWCEAKARSTEGITGLTLEVLRGNRAIGLYERFGFRMLPRSNPCEAFVDTLCVLFLMGRPYGWCAEGWGSIMMEKQLT